MKEISAGGVVYRILAGQIEIQLIQDRYGKVTLPKGKMEPGETIEQTALREIEEETGIKGKIIEPLEKVEYQFNLSEKGIVDKEVFYFLVEASGGTLHAQLEEIRGVEWFAPRDAWKQQRQYGYDNNDFIVRKALQTLGCEVTDY